MKKAKHLAFKTFKISKTGVDGLLKVLKTGYLA